MQVLLFLNSENTSRTDSCSVTALVKELKCDDPRILFNQIIYKTSLIINEENFDFMFYGILISKKFILVTTKKILVFNFEKLLEKNSRSRFTR